MKLVRSVLDDKGYNIWSIAPEAPVFDAIELMSDKGIGALLVLETGELVGIISERDYTRKIILQGKSSRDTPVKAIMSAPVICTSINQPIDECMALMTSKQIRHLPIFFQKGDGEGLQRRGALKPTVACRTEWGAVRCPARAGGGEVTTS